MHVYVLYSLAKTNRFVLTLPFSPVVLMTFVLSNLLVRLIFAPDNNGFSDEK